ncbi:hypothetical protein O9X99_00830 [Agrobacterium salinitolerans]|jgi:hypothetical protein|uniref:Lipoprotein n=1 Tax=Agrobacterium salinitolerans TaxID=1183413 RepID=A0A9X3R0N8_9HYPH|nr:MULTISPECIES: hypothetical protein [Agrobacterium]PNQ23986.1 hypothetical protein C2E26_09990 [Rhizobium sp. YIC5082]MCZ7856875.1 hypothetical protein [Agrobacterium salinitolerans]MCZ7890211.1 hypothetical protein [Agrobacterium salinitolerans]MCZ7938694.1 hypothetical protein [Agrobacterium salinitolerans]OOO25781.1 hypothetical protein BS627_09795 [Agrobacterium salinitolerans]
MSRMGFTPLFPAIIVPAMMLALSGCNTTEALTPQVDVGQNTSQSTPVTQGDLDQMAAAADRAPAGAPATATSVPAYAPQNSLQAQAQALSNGSQYGEPLRQSQTAAAQPAPAQQTASLAPATSGNSIRFLPIIGAPVQAVTPLSRQLGAEARAKGLTIRASNDNSAENILKGYFSAFADGGKVNIVYVWDILDANGVRLHRLQGQESVVAKGSDPWAAVTDRVMQDIAAKTLGEYTSWKQSQRG